MPDPEEKEEAQPEQQETDAPPDNSEAESTVKEWLDKSEDEETVETEPEPAPETKEAETPPAKPEPPAEPEYPDMLLRDAWAIGMTWEQVRKFTPEQLGVVVDNAVNIARSFRTPEKTGTDKKEESAAADPPELDPDEIDESILANINYLKKELREAKEKNARLDELEQVLSRVTGTIDKDAQRKLEEKAQQHTKGFIDTVYQAGMTDLFGENENTCSDEQWDNVMRVHHAAMDLETGYRRRGQELPDDLFVRAIRAEFGDRIKQDTVRELSRKVERRSKASIARPTQRKSPASQGSDAEAIQAVKEYLAAMEE